MLGVLDRTQLRKYAVQVNCLEQVSQYRGQEVDEHLGITYPPYPIGLAVGSIIFDLNHLHECVEGEGHQVILNGKAMEAKEAFYHFIRARWPQALKSPKRLSSATKPLGVWYEATYDLCVQVAPYIPINGKLGVDGAYWFQRCVKEVTAGGGPIAMLDLLYPPTTNSGAKGRGTAKGNKQKLTTYMNALISRIKNLEKPKACFLGGDVGQYGYFGSLLLYAVTAAGKDHKIQSVELRAFIKATRDYAKAVGGKYYVEFFVDDEGKAFSKRSEKHPKKKSAAVAPREKGFQELNIYLCGGP